MPKGSKLTALQEAFVREYMLSRNASDAMRKAGYKTKSPHVDASKLLANPSIAAALAVEQRAVQVKYEITKDMIIRELAAIAFGNMANLFKWDHENAQFIPKDDLTPEQMKFIDSIEVKESWEEIPNDDPEAKPWQRTIWKPVKKFKIGTLGREKVKALELIAKLSGHDNPDGNGPSESEKALNEALSDLDKIDSSKK
jgi:phage terminase small subunit